jgi:hypothetical protein
MSLRRIEVPSLKKTRVIGGCRLPHPLAHLHAPKLRYMLTGPVPQTPASIDYTAPAASVIANVEGNDKYGDCVEAEEAHFIGVVTGAGEGTLYSYTPEQTLALYTALTGFNPNDPSTDQGTDPVACLNYFTQNAYADGSKLAGWAMGDANDQALTQYGLDTFGNAKAWLGLPDALVQNMPTASGFVWDTSLGGADNANGHCVGFGGYTEQGVIVMTWGMTGIITWDALASWCVPAAGGGIAHRVTSDWINRASGNSPTGLNLAALQSVLAATFGSSAA